MAKRVKRTPKERADHLRRYQADFKRRDRAEANDVSNIMASKCGDIYEKFGELTKLIHGLFCEFHESWMNSEDLIRHVRFLLDILEVAVGNSDNVLAISPNSRCDLQTVLQVPGNWKFTWREGDKSGLKDKPFSMSGVHVYDDLTSLIYKYFNHLDPVNIDHCPSDVLHRFSDAGTMAVSPVGDMNNFPRKLLNAARERLDELQGRLDEFEAGGGVVDFGYRKPKTLRGMEAKK